MTPRSFKLKTLGIVIKPMNTASYNHVDNYHREKARENNDNDVIMVMCLANQGVLSIEGQQYRVVTFRKSQ